MDTQTKGNLQRKIKYLQHGQENEKPRADRGLLGWITSPALFAASTATARNSARIDPSANPIKAKRCVRREDRRRQRFKKKKGERGGIRAWDAHRCSRPLLIWEGCGAYSRAVLAIHPARLRGVKERPAFTTSRFRWGPLARARSGILLMFKQRTVIFPCITVWGPREIDRTRSSLTEFYDVKKAGPCPRSDIQSAGPALTVSVVDGRELDTSFWLGGGERRGKSLHDFFMKTFFHRMIPGDRVRSIIPTHFPSIYMLSSTDAVACSHARSRPSNALADQNFQS
ncbi:hypothetical protein BHE74_00039587 [Ensete ventricosum]|nr:hypothetical protein BHE74_00039587 [Ensete ventricosum]